MNSHIIQILAGISSSLIFVISNIPMLAKAIKTKDLSSYSLGNLALRNIGNIVYWPYVLSLPLGPIWFLQAFFTLASVLMLICYLYYEKNWFHFHENEGEEENKSKASYHAVHLNSLLEQ